MGHSLDSLPPNLRAKVVAALHDDNHAHAKVSPAKPAQSSPALAADSKGEAQGTGRPHVSFTLRRVHLLDWDGKYGVLKDLLDGLVTCGLLPGDREDQITGTCQQIKVAHFADEKTIIEVTYP